VVAVLDGRDSNRKSYTTPPKDTDWLLVGPQYHALHRIDPAAYISSTFRLFDWILGTGRSLRSRRITIGASGAFGSAMKLQGRAAPFVGYSTLKAYSRSKRSFLPHARALYDDLSILYRHIVLSAFHLEMGFAIVSAEWAASVAMWWIRRGARYIPVTYTGLAYLNYFKFMYWIKKA
jgi:hypothetical protein